MPKHLAVGNTQISAVLKIEDVARLDVIAREQRISRSEVIGSMVAQCLDAEEQVGRVMQKFLFTQEPNARVLKRQLERAVVRGMREAFREVEKASSAPSKGKRGKVGKA